MTDWQIIESDNFPDMPPEDVLKPGWRRWSWGATAAGLLLFLALTGFWGLRQRQMERQAVLQEELSLIVFEEETRRAVGQLDETRLDPEAPSDWQEAYRRTFEPDEIPAAQTGQLSRVDYFDGRCALATLAGATFDSVRAYCLAGTGWRRTPIPPAAWGEVQLPLQPAEGVQVYFQARDQAFAKALAGDLTLFFNRLDQLPAWLENGAVPKGLALDIVIAPYDLHGPLIMTEAERIVLNSPQLVTLQMVDLSETTGVLATARSASLNGEAVVRLALAEALLPRTHPFRPDLIRELPGAQRFVAAAQTILAVRMLLPPEAQSALLAAWREQLNGRWVSPFFADLLPMLEAGEPTIIDTTAYLLADYIYHRHGPEALAYLLSRLPRAASWNRLFGDLPMHSTFSAVAGRAFSPSTTFRGASEQLYSTLLLEIEAAYYAQAGQTAIAALRRDYSQPIPALPFTASLRRVDLYLPGQQPRAHFPHLAFHLPVLLFRWPYSDDRLGGRRLYGVQPDRATPLLIETSPELVIQTPDGLPISPGCLGPGTELLLEGEWLEAPYRLRANRAILQAMPLLAVPPPAPADTVAFLLMRDQDPPLTSQESAQPRPAQSLVALRANGLFQPLLDIAPGLHLFPLPITAGQPVHFLIQFDLPDCDRSWFAHYQPGSARSTDSLSTDSHRTGSGQAHSTGSGQGFRGQWFAPPAPVQWVWQTEQAEPIFLKRTADKRGYRIYQAGQITAFERPGLSNAAFWFIGRQAATGQLVSVNFRSDQTQLGLLDLEAGQMTWLANPPSPALQAAGLSPGGDWLVYPAGLSTVYGPSNRIYLLELARPLTVHTLRLKGGAGLASLAWSPYLDQPALALIAGPIRSDYSVRPRQLLLVRPDQPETLIEVTQIEQGQRLAAPVFCSNGELLYRVGEWERNYLMRQQPGQPAERLLTLDRPFEVLACNN